MRRHVFVWAAAITWAIAWCSCLSGCEAAEAIEIAIEPTPELPDEEIVESGFCTAANSDACREAWSETDFTDESSTGDEPPRREVQR